MFIRIAMLCGARRIAPIYMLVYTSLYIICVHNSSIFHAVMRPSEKIAAKSILHLLHDTPCKALTMTIVGLCCVNRRKVHTECVECVQMIAVRSRWRRFRRRQRRPQTADNRHLLNVRMWCVDYRSDSEYFCSVATNKFRSRGCEHLFRAIAGAGKSMKNVFDVGWQPNTINIDFGCCISIAKRFIGLHFLGIWMVGAMATTWYPFSVGWKIAFDVKK